MGFDIMVPFPLRRDYLKLLKREYECVGNQTHGCYFNGHCLEELKSSGVLGIDGAYYILPLLPPPPPPPLALLLPIYLQTTLNKSNLV